MDYERCLEYINNTDKYVINDFKINTFCITDISIELVLYVIDEDVIYETDCWIEGKEKILFLVTKLLHNYVSNKN